MTRPLILGILISGRGSNMKAICQAISDKRLSAQIGVILSDNPQSDGLAWAKAKGFDTQVDVRDGFQKRSQFEHAIVAALQAHQVDFVVLAGYMRVVGPTLRKPYQGKMINIHPSLLPAFPGLHAQRQALDYGVQITGCTVHLVDHTLDGGPILRQVAVSVLPGDTEDTLSERILAEEHRLLPQVLQDLAMSQDNGDVQKAPFPFHFAQGGAQGLAKTNPAPPIKQTYKGL